MNIALIANDTKKDLLAQFCTAYCGILSKHELLATASTGRVIKDTSGLDPHLLYSGQAGMEQVETMVSVGELDVVMLFRDGINGPASDTENDLLRICDVHNLPVATNIATAEALIHALERGDLDWIEYARSNRAKLIF
ncbi:MAG: methylglyoxal synthase [Oscillospiraceae bacterium]|jgi:methylglyoxal synthase|nr:methylglyoxal synthase [Oscillospiraceae bacterium]